MNALDAFDRLLASLHRATLDDARRAAAALIEEACGATGNGQGAVAPVTNPRRSDQGLRLCRPPVSLAVQGDRVGAMDIGSGSA